MSDPHLPTPAEENGDEQQPEVRLELTRAGVQEVLSLYSQEQRSSQDEPAFALRFEDFERAIKERRRMLGIGALAGLALAIIATLLATPLYPVSAQVVLERHDVTRAESSNASQSGSSAFVATQSEIMQSESVLARALESIPRASHLDDEDDALVDATNAVRASPVSGTQVIALGYLGPDAPHGVALLEALVAAYRQELRSVEVSIQQEKLRAKQAEIEVLDSEALDLETKLSALRVEKGTLGSAANTADAQTALLQDLVSQLTDTRNQRIALENRLATGNDQLAILDPSMRSLQEQLWAAQAELARVRLTLTPRHPAVEAAQREVNVLNNQLRKSSQATPEAIRRDIEAAIGLEAQLTEVYESERQRMSTIEIDRREESLLLGELERVRQMTDTRRSELLDQRLISRLAENGEIGVSARLIARPQEPEGAAWPRPKLMLVAGLTIGLLIGLVAAIISLRRETEEEVWASPAGNSGR